MKIAIIGQRWNPNYILKFRGGGEKVESDHVKLLSEKGHEVHFLTNDDSEERKTPVKTHFVGPSKFSLNGGRMSGKRSSIVVRKIMEINPDIVLIHDNDNSTLNIKLSKVMPCVAFVHSCVEIVGGISVLNYLHSLYELAKNGSFVVCVSEHSRKSWECFLLKNKDYLQKNFGVEEKYFNPGEVFKHVLHNPILWEKPKPQETNNGYISIGRLIKIKNHHIGLENTEDITLYCPSPWKGSKESEQLYKKLSEKYSDKIVLDSPHSKLMQNLSQSKALLSFSTESFGMTAFEANSQGIPVILFHKDTPHAIEEACAPGLEIGGLVRVSYSKDAKELREFLRGYKGLTMENRIQLIEKTWNY